MFSDLNLLKKNILFNGIFTILLFIISLLFFKPIARNFITSFNKHFKLPETLQIFYNKLPPFEWFYDNPSRIFPLIIMTSFSAFFIAPLNSINSSIKDGNLIQVTYIRDSFNYAVVNRYILILTASVLVGNFLFLIGCLLFVVVDVLFFYKKYSSFIFNNKQVLVNFLTEKIKEENKTRIVFLDAYKDFTNTIRRYERKHKIYETDYNNFLTFSAENIEDLDKRKFRNFLDYANHKLNPQKNKTTSYRRIRFFNSTVTFNLRQLKITVTLSYNNSAEISEKSLLRLKNEFSESFDYLTKKEILVLHHLMGGLDIHFFDLYQKNEFKLLFSNIDLIQEAIKKTDLRIGTGVFDVLYFFSKIFNNYPDMNKLPVLNDKLYHLWLEVFNKSIDLDKNLINFIFRNFGYGISQKFFGIKQIKMLDQDLLNTFKYKNGFITKDFIFNFLFSLTKLTLYLEFRNLNYTLEFADKILYFGKVIEEDHNLGLKPDVCKDSIFYSKQGLLLLAAYQLTRKKLSISFKILEKLDLSFEEFCFFTKEKENLQNWWKWLDWFQTDKIILEKNRIKEVSLTTSIDDLMIFYFSKKLNKLIILKKNNLIKEQIPALYLLKKNIKNAVVKNKLNKLINSLKEKYQETIKKLILNNNRKKEFIANYELEYKDNTKISDFISPKFVNKLGKKLYYHWVVDREPFVKKEPLQIEHYEDFGDHLIEVENNYFIKQLAKHLKLATINYEELFTKILLEAIKKNEIDLIFIGNPYKITQFFNSTYNKYLPELELIETKKQTSLNPQTTYLLKYRQQKKQIYFSSATRDSNFYCFLYNRKDKINLSYFKTTNKDFELSTHYSNCKFDNLKLDSTLASPYLKSGNIDKQKITASEKITITISIAPLLEFLQQRYNSKFFMISE